MTGPSRPTESPPAASPVSFWQAFRFWLKLGFINFGGPTGQIAIMHQELVDRLRWISNDRFLHALNYCMLLPGPEATQLAIYVGWLLHRTIGGIVAGVFFVLPAFFVLLLLSWVYAVHGTVPWIAAIFFGLRAAVIAIVAAAVIRIGRRALKNRIMLAIAAAAFVGIFVFKVPFPVIVVSAGLLGMVGARLWPGAFGVAEAHGAATAADHPVIRDDAPPAPHTQPSRRRALVALAVGLAAWWIPLGAVIAWRGWGDVLAEQAVFFSKAALVTFGGAYAVLAYLAQAAVEQYRWLAPGEMLVGLGLAESTPGPLIMVTEFVGFMGAYRHPGDLSPLLAGTLGAAVTIWATFAPSFLFIFLGAPYIEQIRGHATLGGALSAITAAVVGVVLNLAVWFGLHTLFRTVVETAVGRVSIPVPHLATVDVPALLIAVVAFVGMWRFNWGIVPVVAGSAAVGLLVRALTG
ncbi:MAG: chromate efflux transporter [Armatimonadetes bacterium]|nr:chromate efflux transporter [Armatimonadota bacterium]